MPSTRLAEPQLKWRRHDGEIGRRVGDERDDDSDDDAIMPDCSLSSSSSDDHHRLDYGGRRVATRHRCLLVDPPLDRPASASAAMSYYCVGTTTAAAPSTDDDGVARLRRRRACCRRRRGCRGSRPSDDDVDASHDDDDDDDDAMSRRPERRTRRRRPRGWAGGAASEAQDDDEEKEGGDEKKENHWRSCRPRCCTSSSAGGRRCCRRLRLDGCRPAASHPRHHRRRTRTRPTSSFSRCDDATAGASLPANAAGRPNGSLRGAVLLLLWTAALSPRMEYCCCASGNDDRQQQLPRNDDNDDDDSGGLRSWRLRRDYPSDEEGVPPRRRTSPHYYYGERVSSSKAATDTAAAGVSIDWSEVQTHNDHRDRRRRDDVGQRQRQGREKIDPLGPVLSALAGALVPGHGRHHPRRHGRRGGEERDDDDDISADHQRLTSTKQGARLKSWRESMQHFAHTATSSQGLMASSYSSVVSSAATAAVKVERELQEEGKQGANMRLSWDASDAGDAIRRRRRHRYYTPEREWNRGGGLLWLNDDDDEDALGNYGGIWLGGAGYLDDVDARRGAPFESTGGARRRQKGTAAAAGTDGDDDEDDEELDAETIEGAKLLSASFRVLSDVFGITADAARIVGDTTGSIAGSTAKVAGTAVNTLGVTLDAAGRLVEGRHQRDHHRHGGHGADGGGEGDRPGGGGRRKRLWMDRQLGGGEGYGFHNDDGDDGRTATTLLRSTRQVAGQSVRLLGSFAKGIGDSLLYTGSATEQLVSATAGVAENSIRVAEDFAGSLSSAFSNEAKGKHGRSDQEGGRGGDARVTAATKPMRKASSPEAPENGSGVHEEPPRIITYGSYADIAPTEPPSGRSPGLAEQVLRHDNMIVALSDMLYDRAKEFEAFAFSETEHVPSLALELFGVFILLSISSVYLLSSANPAPRKKEDGQIQSAEDDDQKKSSSHEHPAAKKNSCDSLVRDEKTTVPAEVQIPTVPTSVEDSSDSVDVSDVDTETLEEADPLNKGPDQNVETSTEISLDGEKFRFWIIALAAKKVAVRSMCWIIVLPFKVVRCLLRFGWRLVFNGKTALLFVHFLALMYLCRASQMRAIMIQRNAEVSGYRAAIESIRTSSPMVVESVAWFNALLAQMWRVRDKPASTSKYPAFVSRVIDNSLLSSGERGCLCESESQDSCNCSYGGFEPFISSYFGELLVSILESSYEEDENRPNDVAYVSLYSFTIGAIPPTIRGVEILGVEEDSSTVRFGFDIDMHGDASLVLDVKLSSLEHSLLPATKIAVQPLSTKLALKASVTLTDESPFVAFVNVSLAQLPKCTVKVIPQSDSGLRGIDLGSFPYINNWIQTSLAETLSEYVAPRYISVDVVSWLSAPPSGDAQDGSGMPSKADTTSTNLPNCASMASAAATSTSAKEPVDFYYSPAASVALGLDRHPEPKVFRRDKKRTTPPRKVSRHMIRPSSTLSTVLAPLLKEVDITGLQTPPRTNKALPSKEEKGERSRERGLTRQKSSMSVRIVKFVAAIFAAIVRALVKRVLSLSRGLMKMLLKVAAPIFGAFGGECHLNGCPGHQNGFDQ